MLRDICFVDGAEDGCGRGSTVASRLDRVATSHGPRCHGRQLTTTFPNAEIYRLTAQLTRAAVSVPANIAEGNARHTLRDYANFVSVAKGSLMEAETCVLLSVRLGYISDGDAAPVLSLIVEISKMLTVLRARLRDA